MVLEPDHQRSPSPSAAGLGDPDARVRQRLLADAQPNDPRDQPNSDTISGAAVVPPESPTSTNDATA